MIIKRLIRPERLRQVPPGFGWIDHRLVRQNFISGRSHSALALYLFLVTVADAQGLSYYSDPALCRRLNMTAGELAAARQELLLAELIAYQKPLYQALSLDSAPSLPSGGPREEKRAGQPQSAGEILRRVLPSAGGGA